MRITLLMLALTVPAMAQAADPAPVQDSAKALWSDWGTLSRRAAEAQPEIRGDSVAEARTLGDRVGKLVAAGDCRGGERMALAAGDSALVRAVRDYCR
jgi:hypothetical protein